MTPPQGGVFLLPNLFPSIWAPDATFTLKRYLRSSSGLSNNGERPGAGRSRT